MVRIANARDNARIFNRPRTIMTNALLKTPAAATYRNELLARAERIPLDEMDVTNFSLFQHDAIWPYFERLRREDPVHYHTDSHYGPFWSITRFNDIKAIDTDHGRFSSEPTIGLFDAPEDFELPMFIAMDQPKHDVQRKAVSPVVGPRNLAAMEALIRERTCEVLDSLPVGTEFNWVDRVSIELTTRMLATLFGFRSKSGTS